MHGPFAVYTSMQSAGGSGDKMSTKRRASESSDEEQEVPEKRPRRRRSRSEPRNTGSGSNKSKQELVDRLFGKFCSHDVPDSEASLTGGEEEEEEYYEDPLLHDSVPEYLDPEQLGFLLCAQETLGFLRQTGVSHRSSVYVTLRSRFLEAMRDLGIA